MVITYTNSNGESLTLQSKRPFFLTKVEGTGKLRQTINTFKAPEQDGAFYISSTMDMRNITLEGTVVATTADQAYEERKRLLRVFTPKASGTLIYHNTQIPCIVEEAGFVVGISERSPVFFISLLCPSPFFQTLEDVRVELATWLKKFSFLLEIPESGMEFGVREPSQIITVDNFGDVSCGCKIVFKALGTVVNPELMNVDTVEVVKLNKAMTAGEEIHVYTHFAGKKVQDVKGDTISNAFYLLDTDSTFIQLSAGRNMLRYNAEDNLDLLEVSIFFRPQFLGV